MSRYPTSVRLRSPQATQRERHRSKLALPLRLEELEVRQLLNYTVNNSGDAPLAPPGTKPPGETSGGVFTLRSTIQQINIDGGGEIDFSVSTVNCSNLPTISVPATINGGAIGSVVISGSGLNFTGGDSIAEYLVINGSSGDGIDMSGASNQVITDYVGTDQTGMSAVGNAGSGVQLFGANNTVSGCVLSANGGDGLLVNGSGATGNLITGNMIGTNSAGTAALGNADWGVILDQAPSNTVGGTSASSRNLVSGNKEGGVGVYGGSATADLVEGNYIGTDATGTIALGNAFSGVYVGSGSLFSDNPPGSASSATIGGTTTGAGNLISGNDTANTGNGGVVIYGSGASANLIEGNQIGVNAAGTAALANLGVGVDIFGGATSNTVGGASATAANVISGNQGSGVTISDDGTSGNLVLGNFIGTNAAGTVAISNLYQGVLIDGGATSNTVGGASSSARNVISGNLADGVDINNSGTSQNLVEGNFIGIDINDNVALANTGVGLGISDSASNNTIGGTTSAARQCGIGQRRRRHGHRWQCIVEPGSRERRRSQRRRQHCDRERQ